MAERSQLLPVVDVPASRRFVDNMIAALKENGRLGEAWMGIPSAEQEAIATKLQEFAQSNLAWD